MKRLITLALSLLLLGNSALADNSTVNDGLEQWIQDRNAVIEASLQRKLDALVDDRIRQDDRFREYGSIPQRQYLSGNLLVAAR